MNGQGAKIGSGWAFEGYGIHLPRKALNYGDIDDAEKSIWQNWFFETAPGGAVFIKIVNGNFRLAGAGGLAS